MGRWEANARGRLQQAAIELYSERGFDQTTVAEIAGRAGLTQRTFFRHFADKREVLFDGEDALRDLLVLAVAGAADSASPIAAFAAGLKATVAVYFEHRPRDQARKRQAVIAANEAIQERELIKLSRLAAGVAGALRGRGVTEPAASLTAEVGMLIFRIAVERWIDDTGNRDLAHHIDEAVAEFRALADGELTA
jgi:AcrR family transcriptional regulator